MYGEVAGFLKTASRRFVWAPVEVMESPEWCRLSINARRVMDRLLIENVRHKSGSNGKLRISFRQFVGYGVHGLALGGLIHFSCSLLSPLAPCLRRRLTPLIQRLPRSG
jgi:hypothetical protein